MASAILLKAKFITLAVQNWSDAGPVRASPEADPYWIDPQAKLIRKRRQQRLLKTEAEEGLFVPSVSRLGTVRLTITIGCNNPKGSASRYPLTIPETQLPEFATKSWNCGYVFIHSRSREKRAVVCAGKGTGRALGQKHNKNDSVFFACMLK